MEGAIDGMWSCRSSTPAFTAAAYASSGTGSQAANTRSSRAARGTNSLMSGARLSVRFPSRMVPIWVSEPIGLAAPRRTFSTPAMKVVATAPRPTQSTPSFPRAGAMRRAVCSATRSSFRESIQRGPLDVPGTRRLVRPVRGAEHVHEPLDDGDHRGGRQQRHQGLQHDGPGTRTHQEREEAEPQDPLGPLGDADLALETEPLGA